MPQVIVTQGAIRGLERCRKFLMEKNPKAAMQAAKVISKNFTLLEKHPDMGRSYPEIPELRELVIEFGATGYVALYRYTQKENVVYILAFRHQKEVGYS
ncbi:MAG TPA: type II toxin-antitoxin system RelE/ParE family toxin [Aquella sp.]|nr:type II toxin-antitoxin system RelE/ParE family toxin [Aquella sp.]